MGATSAASGTTPMVVVGVVLALAILFIAFCIGIYKYLEKRKSRAAKQDLEAQQKASEWREVVFKKVWPAALIRKNKTSTPTPRDGEVSVVLVDSTKHPYAAVPAIPLRTIRPTTTISPMPTIAE